MYEWFNYDDAVANCVAKGMSIFSIENINVEKALNKLSKEYFPIGRWWIGGERAGTNCPQFQSTSLLADYKIITYSCSLVRYSYCQIAS